MHYGQIVDDENLLKELTPSSEDQIVAILKGKCPHNGLWIFSGKMTGVSIFKCQSCHILQVTED